MANNSDKRAKQLYKEKLEKKGYRNVKIMTSPVDIVGWKKGIEYFFEIKKTSKKDIYFGAATLTEWKVAYENPKSFKFVVAQEINEKYYFTKYTPEEFEKFSTIPPFKIYFNIPLEKGKKTRRKRKNRKAVSLNEAKFIKMDKFYDKLKE